MSPGDRQAEEMRDPAGAVSDPDAVAQVGQALSHPIRVLLISAMRDGSVISPVRFSKAARLPLGAASYHTRALVDLGVLQLVDSRPVRGSHEHFYALAGVMAPCVAAALDVITAHVG